MMRSDSLYASVLGDQWKRLSPAVQRLHGGATRYRGTFCVTRGRSVVAKVLGRVLRLPSDGQNVPIDLEVVPDGDTERWIRRFSDEVLESSQWAGPRGLLVEQFGPMELRMALKVVSGALEYHVRNVALRWGPLRLPLPCPKASHPDGREAPCDDGRSVDVSVSARIPWFGLLVGYQGVVAPDLAHSAINLPD